MPEPRTRLSDTDAIERIWQKYRPYWHVISTLVIIIFIVSQKYAKVNSYDDRLVALEVWRIEVSKDLATMGQEIHDIHDQVVPRR